MSDLMQEDEFHRRTSPDRQIELAEMRWGWYVQPDNAIGALLQLEGQDAKGVTRRFELGVNAEEVDKFLVAVQQCVAAVKAQAATHPQT